MKKNIIILLILSFNVGFCQVEIPFFEQISFDFYKDSILPIYPVEKRLKISKYTIDLHSQAYNFQVNECLTGETLTEGKELELFDIYVLEQMDFDSPTHLMNYTDLDKKQFRIKKSGTKNYPNLKISMPYNAIDELEEFYVIITENYERKNISYFLAIDINGIVKNWCRRESNLMIIY